MEEVQKGTTDEIIARQQAEEKKKHQEEQKQMIEKISKVSKEIEEILAREGLTLVVNHQISIVPRQ